MNMDYLPVKKRIRSDATLSLPFIPDEIIAEILCRLNVKTIVQLKCVSKAWKTLISDPTFIKKHLKISSQNPHLLFTPPKPRYSIDSVKSFPVVRLLDTDSLIIVFDNFYGWEKDKCQVIGTCMGLLCLFFHYRYRNYWFCLWNPATRTLSERLGISQDHETLYDSCQFTFGCDISTGTYKVVALSKIVVREENAFSVRNQFRVMSLGENCWRNFKFCSSILPVCMIYAQTKWINNGLHLKGTVNWLALPKYIKRSNEYESMSIANAQQFVIISLDLSTETCTQFLLPPGFDEVQCFQPTVTVLMDCLCFSYDLKSIEFVIWQMKEFGVQGSWTMLLKIDYFNIQIINPLCLIYNNIDIISYIKFGAPLLPLYLSNNGDTLILANYEDDQAMIYNQRENTVKRIRIAEKLCCFFSIMDYVESLVSTC